MQEKKKTSINIRRWVSMAGKRVENSLRREVDSTARDHVHPDAKDGSGLHVARIAKSL
jgi:hypothetical protein